MITLYTGLPRNGKTLKAIDDIERKRIAENRPVYYHGITDVKLDWHELKDPQKWYELPQGAMIIFDEAQKVFEPGSPNAVPKFIRELETHGHSGFDMFFITQHPMFIHAHVRRLANAHFHVVRSYGFEKATVHEFMKTNESPDKSVKGSIEHHYLYNKELFGKYKSAEIHNMKKRIPMRLVMFFVLPIILIAVLYFGYQAVMGLADSPETVDAAADKNNLLETPALPSQNHSNQKKEDDPNYWYVQNTPRIATLPHTAPKYDKVTEPVVAPVPAACIASKAKCVCYSQQGTRLQTDELFCRQVAANGFFLDFQDNRNAKPNPHNEPAIQPEPAAPAVTIASNSYTGDGVEPHVDQQPRRVNLNLPPQDASLRFQY